jgi:hypothetical protein
MGHLKPQIRYICLPFYYSLCCIMWFGFGSVIFPAPIRKSSHLAEASCLGHVTARRVFLPHAILINSPPRALSKQTRARAAHMRPYIAHLTTHMWCTYSLRRNQTPLFTDKHSAAAGDTGDNSSTEPQKPRVCNQISAFPPTKYHFTKVFSSTYIIQVLDPRF